jgi:hypothetical protein
MSGIQLLLVQVIQRRSDPWYQHQGRRSEQAAAALRVVKHPRRSSRSQQPRLLLDRLFHLKLKNSHSACRQDVYLGSRQRHLLLPKASYNIPATAQKRFFSRLATSQN